MTEKLTHGRCIVLMQMMGCIRCLLWAKHCANTSRSFGMHSELPFPTGGNWGMETEGWHEKTMQLLKERTRPQSLAWTTHLGCFLYGYFSWHLSRCKGTLENYTHRNIIWHRLLLAWNIQKQITDNQQMFSLYFLGRLCLLYNWWSQEMGTGAGESWESTGPHISHGVHGATHSPRREDKS